MAGLDIENLRFARPGFSLDLDLALPDGAFGVLLGPSGCGKSTVLRLVAGLLEPVSGRITLGGRDIEMLAPDKRQVGLVFQDLALFGHMDARRNIEYGPRLAGLPKAERKRLVDGLSRSFHIEDLLARRPAQLSGGERQRVALARSLAAHPALLLLDEPLSALDAPLRRELRTEIRSRVLEAGIPALHVTHDIEEGLALADRLFLMDRGRVVEAGSPQEVYDYPRTAFAARLLNRGPLIPVKTLKVSGGEALGECTFGSFACPTRSGQRQDTGRASYLHFAWRAGRIVEAGEVAGTGLALHGKVVSATYIGTGWRLELVSTGGGTVSVETEPGDRPLPGSEICYFVPGESLRIVDNA